MKYSADEMRVLEKNSHVRVVTPLTFVLNDSLYKSLFEEWQHNKSESTIREGLCRRGIPEDLISEQYVDAVTWSFQGNNGYLRCAGLRARACEIGLISSGLFTARNDKVVWDPDFKESLLDHYPEETFEDGILKAGLTPEMVGQQRMASLRHAYIERIEREERYQEYAFPDVPNQETTFPDKQGGGAWQYGKHPYVASVSGSRSLTMAQPFYNEATFMKGLSIQELLELYEIDPESIGSKCVTRIRGRLIAWKRTDKKQEKWNEQVIRIQYRRLQMLISQTEKTFGRIRNAVKQLRPSQKKQLCLQLSEYPTSAEYPYGYSIRQILEKTGISKTVYYRALFDEGYALGEERRMERDRRDLEKIREVLEYKGFEKGIRQIYMMLPDLTGETFAISKIRRLLRQNGIKTEVRGENPARQRMGKFLERNRKPNLLKREFRLHRPNEVRLTDVTYLDYGTGPEKQRAYGSSSIDPVTGKLLVFHVAENNDLEIALLTLERLSEYPAVEGALFHSDQGILYFTDEFQKKVAEMGMVQSMSKRGNCWDNAPQESFFGHFKDECGYASCETFEELQAVISEYAWYYNNERHQWNRKRMTPVQYEEYLLSLDEEGFSEYMHSEQEKYDRMKEKAEKQAAERAKNLGV